MKQELALSAAAVAVHGALATLETPLTNLCAPTLGVAPVKQLHAEVGAIIASVSAEVEAHDAEVAADEAIAKAKEVEKTPEQIASDELIAKFVPVKNNSGRIQIVSPELRDFIFQSMDVNVVSREQLEVPTDTNAEKLARLNRSVYSLGSIFASIRDFRAVTEEDVQLSPASLAWPNYQIFLELVNAHYKIYEDTVLAERERIRQETLAAFKEGVVTFDQLVSGMNMNLNTLMTVKYKGATIAAKSNVARKGEDMEGVYASLMWSVNGAYDTNVGESFAATRVPEFMGQRSFKSLGFEFLEVDSEEYKLLVARGRQYLALIIKPAFTKAKGFVIQNWGRKVQRFNAEGRVVIDQKNMRKLLPNYQAYECVPTNKMRTVTAENLYTFSDDVAARCIPFVYGFSFNKKVWGEFQIDQLSDIEFRTDAFHKLVLDQEIKDQVCALVDDSNPVENTDLIDGKGGGCVILMEGPPGVGKTLTAEASAERTRKPLYMVSAGDLGTDVDTLEAKLQDILELCASWGAILLIDEADAFLEARAPQDIHRNALVAVFLRLLEYYQGTMFLTTNRADNMDQAFDSRITLCLHFKELPRNDRKKIWVNLLGAAKVKGVQVTDELTNHKLNGRQIKHIIKVAGAMARYHDGPITMDYFRSIIRQRQEFNAQAVHTVKKPNFFRRVWNAITGK